MVQFDSDPWPKLSSFSVIVRLVVLERMQLWWASSVWCFSCLLFPCWSTRSSLCSLTRLLSNKWRNRPRRAPTTAPAHITNTKTNAASSIDSDVSVDTVSVILFSPFWFHSLSISFCSGNPFCWLFPCTKVDYSIDSCWAIDPKDERRKTKDFSVPHYSGAHHNPSASLRSTLSRNGNVPNGNTANNNTSNNNLSSIPNGAAATSSIKTTNGVLTPSGSPSSPSRSPRQKVKKQREKSFTSVVVDQEDNYEEEKKDYPPEVIVTWPFITLYRVVSSILHPQEVSLWPLVS